MPKANSPKAKKSRSRAVAAIEAPAERGLFVRMLLHSPKDMVAGLIAAAAVSAIIGNAIFLQAGHHPSPMFGSSVTVPMPQPATANLLPKPRPLDATLRPGDAKLDSRMLDAKPVDGKSDNKPVERASADPMAGLVKSTTTPPANSTAVARPPAPIPNASRDPLGDLIVNSRRVAAVQRALTEYGYGQLKPTGTVGSDTQAAIQRFERERKLPVTGQASDRVVRELATVTGRPIE
ncbi:peptidoglycan-binding domain-containing protein [Tardiphaga sp.]|uniref:peptidoglycan-binding domain-containing protein n=1 Tax=Tardiphaga sp. TaxID=1926292 RepID=UPI0026386737|nr:peptidoglycan-binding domain-containing protein [Tardiphaga sp.]MDB5619957.1 Peptidoglycan-binding domain 1 [Tardiphaga sp.]